jgi:hypothetical protein
MGLAIMEPIAPQWFKQRQGKLEPAGTDTYRLTAPNAREAFISIRRAENGRWSAALRLRADGADVADTEPEFERPEDGWRAAFELYRVHEVV